MPDRLGELAEARNLLRNYRPELELAPINEGSKHVPAKVKLTSEQWRIARAISRNLCEEARPALTRRLSAEAEIVQQCEAKELISAYRPERGGALTLIPPEWWNTESNHNRFVMCQINPRDPFGNGFAGENFAWIFVTRESLDRYVTSQPNSKCPEIREGHLSPYMRVMLSVASNLQISTENQPKKEVVIAALRSSWSGKPLSSNLIETMATLLQEPEN